MDPRDGAGLVGDGRAGREAGGNRVVELLPLRGSRPSRRRPRVDRRAVRELLEQDEQAARGRRVVQPFVERLLILDAAQHVHAVGAERRRPSAGSFSAPSLSISRFAAKLLLDRDHRLAQLRAASSSCRRPRRSPCPSRRPRSACRRCRRRCCGTRCGSASGSSSASVPALACRNSSIITGTFIVLAAWNGLPDRSGPRPGRRASAARPRPRRRSRRWPCAARTRAPTGDVCAACTRAAAETLNRHQKQGEAHGDCAGGASCYLRVCFGMARKARPSGALNGTKVVVLGAGLAGLAAARDPRSRGRGGHRRRSPRPRRRPGPDASDRVLGRPACRGRRGPDRIDAVARARASGQTWV